MLAFLARHAAWALAAGVLVGLALPELARLARPLLSVAVWGLLVLSMVRVEWPTVIRVGRRTGPVLAILTWLLVVTPGLVWLLVDVIEPAPGIAVAVVLMAAAPPIMSAPAFALLMGLEAPLSMVVMLLATLLAPFTLPLLALDGLGLELAVSGIELALRMATLVGSALFAAALWRCWSGAERLKRSAPTIDGVAVLLLLVFAIAIMDGVAASLAAHPARVFAIVALAFAANLALQAGSALAFAWLGRNPALTVAFLGGNRNMALLLAVLPAGMDPDVHLWFALGQLPIYMLPALLAPLYRRLQGNP